MCSTKDAITAVRVYRKRVSKTLIIENITELKPSEKIYFDILIENNIYVLNIGIFSNENAPYIYLAIDHHTANTKRDVEFKVTLKDNEGHQFFRQCDLIKPNTPLVIPTKYSLCDLPCGCLMIHYELSCISWTEEKAKKEEKEALSFSRTENLSRDFGLLYSQRTNADVVIQVGKGEIPAHSQILTARSEVFAAMFKHDMTEKLNRTIRISDISALAMHYFLLFIYTGKIEEMKDLRQDTLKQLYSAADKYAVNDLKEMCSEFLLSNMSLDNVASCAELAFRHCDKRMQEAVIDFVSKNLATLDSRQWRELEDTEPSVAAEVVNTICIKDLNIYSDDISSSRDQGREFKTTWRKREQERLSWNTRDRSDRDREAGSEERRPACSSRESSDRDSEADTEGRRPAWSTRERSDRDRKTGSEERRPAWSIRERSDRDHKAGNEDNARTWRRRDEPRKLDDGGTVRGDAWKRRDTPERRELDVRYLPRRGHLIQRFNPGRRKSDDRDQPRIDARRPRDNRGDGGKSRRR